MSKYSILSPIALWIGTVGTGTLGDGTSAALPRSVRLDHRGKLCLCGGADEFASIHGKPEAFRKVCGKAAWQFHLVIDRQTFLYTLTVFD